jgi:hypothetical protein
LHDSSIYKSITIFLRIGNIIYRKSYLGIYFPTKQEKYKYQEFKFFSCCEVFRLFYYLKNIGNECGWLLQIIIRHPPLHTAELSKIIIPIRFLFFPFFRLKIRMTTLPKNKRILVGEVGPGDHLIFSKMSVIIINFQ